MPGPVRRQIVEYAESQLGWPYVWGGESEQEGGFDCSGLVDFAYAAAGRAFPGRPTAEVLWLDSQPIREAELRPGDLVFLLNHRNYAFHVGLYAGHQRVVVAAGHRVPVQVVALDSVPWDVFGRPYQLMAEPVPTRYLPVPRVTGHRRHVVPPPSATRRRPGRAAAAGEVAGGRPILPPPRRRRTPPAIPSNSPVVGRDERVAGMWDERLGELD